MPSWAWQMPVDPYNCSAWWNLRRATCWSHCPALPWRSSVWLCP
uniref:Alternative protein WDR85 n=1 Tax=Homo sapiens TaxID=9606 RepID=L8EAN9_HUMAN|nr:alternative protein WDR85 [Homo sapiens]